MEWDTYFINMARFVSKKSKDNSTQCGTVIVSEDNTILSTGYNGLPRNMKYSEEKFIRPFKYKVFSHSEQNAVANAARHGIKLLNSKAYITNFPCHECMRLLVQSGIVKIFVSNKCTLINREDWKDSLIASKLIAKECNIEIGYINEF